MTPNDRPWPKARLLISEGIVLLRNLNPSLATIQFLQGIYRYPFGLVTPTQDAFQRGVPPPGIYQGTAFSTFIPYLVIASVSKQIKDDDIKC